MKGGETEFWSSRSLRTDDWVGLTSQLYTDIFSADILTPMEEADTTFHLKVEHWNLTRYLNMVLESDWHDDLDVARAVHTPRGNIHIQSPYLDPSLFNPLAMTGTHLASLSNRGWRRWPVLPATHVNLLPRLCVPLPVPHPTEVAIIIYNRDNDDQISMDSCRPIIRHLRECSQPMSGEYLTAVPDTQEQDSDSCRSMTPSLGCRSHAESVYEIGQDLDSLTKSLEHLDTDMTAPVLVQVSARSQSTVDTVAPASLVTQPLVAQYSVRSETSVARVRQRQLGSSSLPMSAVTSDGQRQDTNISTGSIARIASAEDMRIETETVVISPSSGPGHDGFSTNV